MLTCHDIANYFLSLTDEDAGDLISNLKLQKLVYYAQGYHVALFDHPLFNEPIHAWAHGPVIPDLYHRYKEYGAGAIPTLETFDFKKIPMDVKELLDEVYDVLGQFSAWKLRNMTHEETPWLEAKDKPGNLITLASMQEYFKTQLN